MIPGLYGQRNTGVSTIIFWERVRSFGLCIRCRRHYMLSRKESFGDQLIYGQRSQWVHVTITTNTSSRQQKCFQPFVMWKQTFHTLKPLPKWRPTTLVFTTLQNMTWCCRLGWPNSKHLSHGKRTYAQIPAREILWLTTISAGHWEKVGYLRSTFMKSHIFCPSGARPKWSMTRMPLFSTSPETQIFVRLVFFNHLAVFAFYMVACFSCAVMPMPFPHSVLLLFVPSFHHFMSSNAVFVPSSTSNVRNADSLTMRCGDFAGGIGYKGWTISG